MSREVRVNCAVHSSLNEKLRSIRNESQSFCEPQIFFESSNCKLCSCHVEINSSSQDFLSSKEKLYKELLPLEKYSWCMEFSEMKLSYLTDGFGVNI